VLTWLDRLSLLQIALAVIGVPSLIGLGMRLWKRVVKPSVRFVRRVNTALVTVEAISKNLGPNGGKSLYDKIESYGHSQRLSEARLSAVIDVVVDYAQFEADSNGHFTRVNTAFERLIETSTADMVGNGWINVILPQDREHFVKDWQHAVRDCRAFHSSGRFVTQRGLVTFVARCKAEPVLDSTGKVIGWMGAVVRGELVDAHEAGR
jgi:PAS domain S-box-containing protein